jgi:hypothetical protein
MLAFGVVVAVPRQAVCEYAHVSSLCAAVGMVNANWASHLVLRTGDSGEAVSIMLRAAMGII